MGCHGNHEISYQPKSIYFSGKIFFLHFSGPIEQISTHNEISYVFNLGLITPLDTSLPMVFPYFLKKILLFMNMQMSKFS